MRFNINANGIVQYTEKLEKLNRSALPVAVRQTLNSQAFQTKSKELIEEYNKAFTVRAKTVPRAFSKVKAAQGFDIKKMKSMVGMTDRKRGGSSEQVGRDMEQQQQGGRIGGRTFIPLDTARTSNSRSKRVRKKNRLSGVKKVVDSSVNKARSEKQSFVKSSIYAANKYGTGVYLTHRNKRGKRTLYRINKVGRTIRTRKLFIGVTPVYSEEKGRSVRVKGIRFTHRAALRVNKRVGRIFAKHAEDQFKKVKLL